MFVHYVYPFHWASLFSVEHLFGYIWLRSGLQTAYSADVGIVLFIISIVEYNRYKQMIYNNWLFND